VELERPIREAPLHFAGGGETLKPGLAVANDVSDYCRDESLFIVAGPEDVALLAKVYQASRELGQM